MDVRGDNVLDLPVRPDGPTGLGAALRLCLRWIGADGPLSVQEARAFRAVWLAEDGSHRATIYDVARGDAAQCDRLLLTALPRVAAGLGADWCDGGSSFVDVTIACARIHEALRLLGDVARPAPDGACVVVASPRGEDHVLPLALLAYRLRRMGLHARLLSDATAGGVARAFADTGADGIVLGASTDRGFARAIDIVRALRRMGGPHRPVALGGCALSRHRDAARESGADCLSNDLQDALDSFKVTLPGRLGPACDMGATT
ncbi:hypothetical protein JQC91_04275 [Jannaschia sp. Os4]|uniref:hypothetical protein n=1 Tax=Jannaschia sp. Os4 TaxID=2807617 RepID=UPI0019395FA7|nr:hypothetical protein [Jannaschia sp. Os4]MBM2575512.1 hypothetical protein [Jannaschia sp. Os4]